VADVVERLSTALEGRYRIQRELGTGGMATVYLAEDLRHDRKVAIKVLKPELTAVLGGDRFIQEIKTTASLQHPHILPLFDSGTADGFLFYVMPYIEGETLRDRLNHETQLGLEEAVRITTEVADALDYAHRAGIIHRDIKPENILLHDGRPMVADFGIALALSAAAGGRMTETGTSLGTPHYMSPEQATADKELTARSDIYSLGSVLYEMLTGDPPHTASSARQVIMKIIADTPRPVTDLRRSVPPNVAAAVARALEKLPADRFESAEAFADALKNPAFRYSAAGGAAQASAGAASDSVRAWRWTAIAAVTIAAFSIVALVLVLVSSGGPTSAPGPSEYDVGLPDEAPLAPADVSMAVSPEGDYVVYYAEQGDSSELWFRSLMDATARRIDGTRDAWNPALSPDGRRLAFLRATDSDVTVEVVPIEGGTPTVLARSDDTFAHLQWLADGRLLLVEADGNRARWIDPGGGPTTTLDIQYCILASALPDPESLLCGGGGSRTAYRINVRDSAALTSFMTDTPEPTLVYGSDFHVVDGRYLVWLSTGGDLLAAPVDLETARVGRSVRMATGLGRQQYSGSGSFALGPSGTLVWSNGVNGAVGHLVAGSATALDTLPVGRDAFLRFSVSPAGRRLAAVVESLEGEQLRVYDLQTGSSVLWQQRATIRQPVWSPTGDRMAVQMNDSIFVGSPDAAGAPEFLFVVGDAFEPLTWLPDDRLFGVSWDASQAEVVHLDERPVTVDTLFGNAALLSPSPDGRWIAYNSADFTTIWLEPLPRTGRRYQVATGGVEDPGWLSATELAYADYGTTTRFYRVTIDPAADPPVGSRRLWLEARNMVGTAGLSATLTPDGRVVFVQGQEPKRTMYLHVVPDWVSRMKQAVDEANR
jgi:Tol biopolymer transport system component